MNSTIERNEEKDPFQEGFLVENEYYIILISGNPSSDLYFWGTIVHKKTKTPMLTLGTSLSQMEKKKFTPFHGKVILENE